MPETARVTRIALLALLLALMLTACNLGGAPEPSATPTLTNTPSSTPTATSTLNIPTALPLTRVAVPTVLRPTLVPFPATAVIPPTQVAQLPTQIPVNQPQPVRIVILSPVPGSVVAGAVNVIGTAIHPQFLQYQLEYGPDPNPNNLWYPIAISQFPVANGTLGIWNTLGTQDGTYQLRLRVWLRDGTSLSTVTGAIRVQNRAPTPVPSATPSVPRPIAAFAQSATQGQAPLSVQFNNQSAGQITQVRWNFGDGQTSTNYSPSHTFTEAGTYLVTLTVIGPGGTSNVTSQVNVRNVDAPSASFLPSQTRGRAPLTVQFTNQSTGRIREFLWNFGDGTTSTEQNPTHTYEDVGTYNVILSATGPGGTSFATREIRVTNPTIPAPTAAFVANPTQGQAPLRVEFSNRSEGNITNFVWNFGDGTVSTDRDAVHTYQRGGDYVVTLIASGPGGLTTAQQTIRVIAPTNTPTNTAVNTATNTPTNTPTNTATATATATNTPEPPVSVPTSTPTNTPTFTPSATFTLIPVPVAVLTANPTEGAAPLAVQFSSAGSQNAVGYFWDFGDGIGASSEQNPTYTYPRPGTYTARLTVTGPDGRTASDSAVIVVGQPPTLTATVTNTPVPTSTLTNTPLPTATATATSTPTNTPIAVDLPDFAPALANPTEGTAPLTVQFTSPIADDRLTYFWDFGDGLGASTERNPLYTYQNPGNYTATLTVTSPDGRSDSVTVNIDVAAPPTNTPLPTDTPAPQPEAAASANPTEGTAPLTVQFSSQGSQNAVTYFWDFGDGLGASTEANPTYTYQSAGNFTATLTVTSATGAQDSATVNINVAAPPTNTPLPTDTPVPQPEAAVSADPTEGTAPLTVQFSSEGSQNAVTYFWDFGDGLGASTEANPSYTYQTGGSFTATLTVTSATGAQDSATVQVNLTAPAPIARASASPTEGVAPLTVQFDSSASENGVSVAWDFGDGVGTSNEPSPQYTYTTPGQYRAVLTVTGADGTTDRARVDINVIEPSPVPEPEAAASANPTEGNVPLTVQFSSEGSQNAVTYFWDFGDGLGASTEANPSYTYQSPGSYNATLTITSATGAQDNATVQVNVTAPAPVARASANPTEGVAPLTVQFDGSASENAVSFAWDFGDGVGTSNEPNPQYTYTAPGQYRAFLTVTGADGATDRGRVDINVIEASPVPQPEAAASANPTEGVVPLTVQFSSEGSQNAVTYFWDFGDGLGASTEPNPSYTYQTPGNYSVTLTVTGASGAQDSATVQVNVTEPEPLPAPEAAAAADPTEGVAPLAVQFSSEGSQNAVSYFWDFGDGLGASSEANPSYTYQTPGTYTATLSVTGEDGSTDTATVAVTVALPQEQPIDQPPVDQPPDQEQQPTLTLQGFHAAAVNSVAWSPDGTRLASASDDLTIIVWDLASGQPVTQLTGHTERVTSVAWSPDGTRLASGSADDTVRVWDLATGQSTAFAGHTNDVQAVAWNPFSSQVVSGGSDNLAIVWDAATGQQVTLLSGHTDVVSAVAWTTDGAFVATGSADNTVIVWDATTWQPALQFQPSNRPVRSLSFNTGGGRLAVGLGGGELHLWNVNRNESLGTLDGHQGQVLSVDWNKTAGFVASSDANGGIIVWDSESRQSITTLGGHTGAVRAVAWSADGARLATAGDDGNVLIWQF